jgi:SAM-dependent methyltransferase
VQHNEDYPFGRDYWEHRYAEPGMTWSGNPNPVLVDEVAALEPGRALDVGSGEGGDALWLAWRGWRVTAVDIATAALDKARKQAEATDHEAAALIDWQQHDITAWTPDERFFDLISSQFMHLPEPARSAFFLGLAAAVAPGGTLLIVGHDPDTEVQGHRAHLRELMFTAADVVDALHGQGLRIDVAGTRTRPVTSHDGNPATASDVVVRATREA